MKKAKRIFCLLLSFILLWNSTSYLAEAQGADTEQIQTEDSDIINQKKDESGDQKEQDIVEETVDEDAVEDEKVSELEIQSKSVTPKMNISGEEKDTTAADETEPEVPEDVFGDVEFIRNMTTSVDKAAKNITLQWEKVLVDDEIEVRFEAAIYKTIDRSDENPLIVDLSELEAVEEVPAETSLVEENADEAVAAYGEGEAEESTPVMQKVVLDKEVLGENLLEGTVYYIDIRPYIVKTVDADNSDDSDNNEEALIEEYDGDSLAETVTYKEYGEILSTVVVFLAKPVATVKAGDTQCTISWNAVKGASKYELVDASNGKVVQTVNTNSASVKNLKNSMTYSYQVRAVAVLKAAKDENVTYTYVSDLSAKAAGTTKIVTPAVVSGLSITPYNLGAVLKWNKVSGATQYEIYRYDNKTKKWKSLTKTTANSYKNTKLTNKRKYTYKVRAIRVAGGKTAIGGFSSTAKITAKKYLTCSVHPIYYKARVRSTTSLYKESSGKAVAGKIKKGKKVTILKRARGAKGRCYVKINGKGYWINRNKLNFYGGSYTTKDYTTDVKENYINSNGYSSNTKYLIWISSYTQKVNIFKGSQGKWKLYKTYKCTTGRPSASTPQGTFKINKKIRRYGIRTYEKYLTCFYGLTSFHSRLYRGGRIVDSRIGKPISGGCMRMYTNEAKFIYDKMPKGTTVVSF